MKAIVLLSIITTFSFAAKVNNKYNYRMKREKISKPEELLGSARPEEQFLSAISAIESSKNTDVDHSAMSSGIHAGDRAVGEFGIMPNTVREIARRIARRDPRLKLGQTFKGDPEIEQYADPKVPQDVLQFAMDSDPELTNRTARYLEALVDSRFQDPNKMAYAWNQGHNINPATLTEDKLESSPYVTKFKSLQNSFILKK